MLYILFDEMKYIGKDTVIISSRFFVKDLRDFKIHVILTRTLKYSR